MIPADLFLTVIDDYHADAQRVRAWALAATFERPFTGTWNGLQSLERAPDTREVFQDLVKRLPVGGRDNWDQIESSFRFWGRPSAGMFAVLYGGQSDTVHCHVRSGTWAGVCYLAHQELCQGRSGVSFYRHRATGATSFLHDPSAIATFREDAQHPDRWEEIHKVEMRFNRMVLFDGRHFHAASSGFGSTVEDGRLTQLFNIDFT